MEERARRRSGGGVREEEVAEPVQVPVFFIGLEELDNLGY